MSFSDGEAKLPTVSRNIPPIPRTIAWVYACLVSHLRAKLRLSLSIYNLFQKESKCFKFGHSEGICRSGSRLSNSDKKKSPKTENSEVGIQIFFVIGRS